MDATYYSIAKKSYAALDREYQWAVECDFLILLPLTVNR